MIRTDKNFSAACEDLRAGRSTFAEFYTATLPSWRNAAAYILRRWRAPSSCTAEDVVQELVLGAWRAVPRYEPGRGPTLAGFVVFNAAAEAKRWVHRQRGAKLHGNADKAPGNFEVVSKDEALGADRTACEPSPEFVACAREAVTHAVVACVTNGRDEYGVAAGIASRGDVRAAAALLWADPDVRRRCRLTNEAAAMRAARRGVALARHMYGNAERQLATA